MSFDDSTVMIQLQLHQISEANVSSIWSACVAPGGTRSLASLV